MLLIFIFSVSAQSYDGNLRNLSASIKYVDCEGSAPCTFGELVGIDENHSFAKERGTGRDGWSHVLSMNEDYTNFTVSASYRITTSDQAEGEAINMGDMRYAVAYGDASDKGYIRIVNVSADFSTILNLNNFKYEDGNGEKAGLSMIDETHLLVAYDGNDTDGWLKLIEYQPDYSSPTITSQFEYNTTQAAINKVQTIDDNHAIVMYRDVNTITHALVVEWNDTYGNLTQISHLQFHNATASTAELEKVDNSTIIVAFHDGATNDGFLSAITWNETYDLSVISTLEYDNVTGLSAEFEMIDETHTLFSYTGSGSDGFAIVVEWGSGWTNPQVVDRLEFDGTQGSTTGVDILDNNHALITYLKGVDLYGKTITWDMTSGLFPPVITVLTPANNTQSNLLPEPSFSFSDDDNATVSCSLYVDDVLNQTNASTLNNTVTNFTLSSFPTGSHTWEIKCNDENPEVESGKYNYYYDSDQPVIVSGLPVPFNTTVYSNYSMNVYGNATNLNLSNVTLTIFYPNSTVFFTQTNLSFADPTFFGWDFTFNTTTEPNGNWSMEIYAEDLIPNTNTMSIEFTVTNCVPSWSCSGYASCNISDSAPCNETTDSNACGLPYTGNFSEFSPQPCNYCSADFQRDQLECILHVRLINWTDDNFGSCCNVTSISADCDNPYTNSEACSIFSYESGDIAPVTIDMFAKILIAISILIPIFAIIWVGSGMWKRFKKGLK